MEQQPSTPIRVQEVKAPWAPKALRRRCDPVGAVGDKVPKVRRNLLKDYDMAIVSSS